MLSTSTSDPNLKKHAAPTPRRLPIGAEPSSKGTSFRIWAADARSVTVVLESKPALRMSLTPEPGGYFHGFLENARAGDRYRFQLDDDTALWPDPASRFQPEGPGGASEIVDPTQFTWSDVDWRGLDPHGQVIYEMHVGTFSPGGVWSGAIEQLPVLADLGITVIELMPVADFEGTFGWGYDGAYLFAPTRLYGRPDEFRRFVDRAHRLNMGVILDVVYNHFGPGSGYLTRYSKAYCSTRHKTDWGPAPNFDGADAAPVREFVLANAAYWLQEFHLDGFRVDATQAIFDDSSEHILTAYSRHARRVAGNQPIYLVAENEAQDARLITPIAEGGHGFDAVWNDDFHHSAVVAATGRREAYYFDYLGAPQELLSAVKRGFLYQGQRYDWQKKRRGTSALHVPAFHFVTFLQNHDQVANSAQGMRLHQLSSPGRYRALTALLLLGPGTPLLFQGQESLSDRPFLFFADHPGELGELVCKGRLEFLGQFLGIRENRSVRERIARPTARATLDLCKLDPSQREHHAAALALHRDLLRLRRSDPTLRRGQVDGAVVSPEAFVIRFFGNDGDDRLLLVNLGCDLNLVPAPEPLLGPPLDARWRTLISTEDPAYGGCGHGPVETEERGWFFPGQAAVLLTGAPGATEV